MKAKLNNSSVVVSYAAWQELNNTLGQINWTFTPMRVAVLLLVLVVSICIPLDYL